MSTRLRMLFGLLSTVAVILSHAPARAQGEDRAAAIRDVVAGYVDAREKRDAAALTALFTEDADQLVSSGEWRRGREAVVRGGLASSSRSPGARTIAVETVRFVAPDVAIADGRYEVGGTGGAAPRRMWTTFVMRHTAGGWRISAIRNMRPSE